MNDPHQKRQELYDPEDLYITDLDESENFNPENVEFYLDAGYDYDWPEIPDEE